MKRATESITPLSVVMKQEEVDLYDENPGYNDGSDSSSSDYELSSSQGHNFRLGIKRKTRGGGNNVTCSDLDSFLNKYELNHLKHTLKHHKVDYSELPFLTWSHLKELTPKIGEQIKLRNIIKSHFAAKKKNGLKESGTSTAVKLSSDADCPNQSEILHEYLYADENLQQDIINQDSSIQNAFVLNKTEDINLYNLLSELGYREIFRLFQDNEMNVESMKYMTETAVYHVLKDKTTNFIMEFHKKLIEWRKENEIQCCICSSSLSQNIDQARIINRNTSMIPENGDIFNLLDAIKYHESRPVLMDIIEKQSPMTEASRKMLVGAICQWHLSRNIKMTRPIFRNISEQIQMLFKDNKEIYYKIRKDQKRPQGKLYDCFQNKRRNDKNKPASLSTTYASEEESGGGGGGVIGDSNDDDSVIAMKHWLQHHIEPWEDVKTRWLETYHLRRKHILSKEGGDNQIKEVLDDWPLFKHPNGFHLIELDFDFLYEPKRSNLFLTWNMNKNKFFSMFHSRIKDQQNINLLRSLNAVKLQTVNEDLLVSLLLHAILPTTSSLVRSSGKKMRVKYSIADAQNSCFILVQKCADLVSKVREMTEPSTPQPYVIIVGEDYISATEFFSYIDGVLFKFDNFLGALDCCFKTYIVLNLDYPKQSFNFWLFLQRHFYDIKLDTDDPTPTLLSIINDVINQ